MKTNIEIDDADMRGLKALAAKRGDTLSSVVGEFIRRGLCEESRASELAAAHTALPSYSMGMPQVDLSDREALDAGVRA